ncbi:MAG: ribosomal RNA small subunit methyltransferase I, partial [Burkholderiaceae bacterium]
GYLPQEARERAERLRQLEAHALRSGQTQMFIETPYRNAALWAGLMQGLQPNTRLAVASGLTLPQMRLHSQTVQQWRSAECPVDNRTPAVFALGS